jgi:hypothetical protein
MRSRSRAPLGALALILGLVALVLCLKFSSAPVGSVPARDPDIGERLAVQGLVCDREGPLAGARVRFKGDAGSVTTDARGHFQLSGRSKGTGRVTAWKEGYLVGGASLDDGPLLLTLRPLPRDDNEYRWVDPAPDPRGRHNCANCHGEIYREWQRSGHARSATGRHFLNLYLGTNWDGKPGTGWSLLGQHPDGSGVCTACHAPTVAPGNPARFDLSKVQGVDSRGVHCDYCHKVSGDGGGKLGYTHGHYKLDLRRPASGEQLFFGPLDDVDRGEDAYSAFYKDSRYCAACHEGVVFGVHVYSTYSEWRDSPAGQRGQHCQDCHMRPTGTMTNLAPGKGGIERNPLTLGNHRFFAGSREEMLRDCVRLSATLRREANAVRAEVSVRAERVGHRVPTGFVDRHLLLVVEGLEAAGKPVALRAGPVLPGVAGPELAGRPGKLYAKLLKDFEGKSPAPFWRADADAVDTRLYPGRTERLRFEYPPELRRLRVRVLYRRFWQEVTRSKGWPDEDVVVAEQNVE